MIAEPPPTAWAFPDPSVADDDGLVGVGADLEPGTVLAAYRSGLFPMPVRRTIGWWSPDPRGVIPLDALRVSRSLRRSVRRYEVRVNTAFEAVVEACADPGRPHGWISADIERAYTDLHELGWAHSVEAWDDGRLVGGLYGVSVGGLFAGESMFHRAPDASKVALVGLVHWLNAAGARLLDVQWTTDHLRSLGAIDVPRERYLELVRDAVTWTLHLPWPTGVLPFEVS
ncbi:MAG: leucyl/phenylalanyl-tRNA--protein transferase [Actinomycetota bacterium]